MAIRISVGRRGKSGKTPGIVARALNDVMIRTYRSSGAIRAKGLYIREY